MEEEELQPKEVEREVVVEVKVPQVKTLYPYKGQGMGFEKGEVSLNYNPVYTCCIDLLNCACLPLLPRACNM